jgi:maltooligosyltrehalose trehalohydrolase
MELRVWAPWPERVEAVVNGQRYPMARDASGWWSTDVADLAPGADYGFSLDGGDPRPNPRSCWQPDGVHGLSRLVDHGAFAWTDAEWRGVDLATAVLYELHVGTFSDAGTFDGAIGHLDHLVELGITAVEVLPVAEFAGERNWGYDGVDLYAPHSAYGGPDGFKRFVDACHGRGLGVVLDVVYNHFGPEGCYVGAFGPYHTDFFATPWGSALNYDRAGSDDVRAFAVDNAVQWFRDFHVDGLRLDAVPNIIDTSAIHVLEELAAETPGFLIGESDANDPRYFDLGLDATWNDDFHHSLHVALTGERHGYYVDYDGLPDLAHVLRHGWLPRRFSPFRGRTHGRRFTGSGHQLVAYAQNHDQVGNRALGDRLSPAQLRLAAALVLTSPFVPMLFMGEEWGATTPFPYFTSHGDPDLGRAVTAGRRREFDLGAGLVPDPQHPSTFEQAKLDWSEREKPEHAELLEWYSSLLTLRRSTPELRDGRLDSVRVDVDGRVLTVRRGPVTVVADFDTLAVDVRVD